jgi:hypothetical protein
MLGITGEGRVTQDENTPEVSLRNLFEAHPDQSPADALPLPGRRDGERAEESDTVVAVTDAARGKDDVACEPVRFASAARRRHSR